MLTLSFPTRERGLKFKSVDSIPADLSSFPTRERGLKYHRRSGGVDCLGVVPHAGTWIEIEQLLISRLSWSFPTRERGLKCQTEYNNISLCVSFPTRERGLKYL